MSSKYVVVQDALCECEFGDFPDKLKVLSQQKIYANDNKASNKLIATTLEIGGATFEKNTFGQCKMQPMGSSFKPCQIVITQWEGSYENVELTNGGQILLEDSKAICPIGGSPCISILFHGQTNEQSINATTENEEVAEQINPLVSLEDLQAPEIEDQIIVS
ncbi:DUF4280 domain-containing protein [Zobellia uliginosa]|uniref:DUF4280 domain-containing protein n=1 Tax=Zobellia uliginosa TaxID=143224 RepID=UPI001C0651FE|nr:DUF4280 domain-containing protein [Zobellia uliginosa]MBU2946311.1 DUF4280 domain-containing protein [Zobellia uliginosa]